MSKIQYSVTNESVTVVHNGRPTTVVRSAPNFLSLRAALLDERWEDALSHLRVDTSLSKWAHGRFTTRDNTMYFDGEAVPSDINERIVAMATAGEDPTPLFNFWERLQRNPSRRSVEQLWRFLNLTGIPLTHDGHFLAYKGVRMDYLDCHSGKIDNHPGQHPKVPRNRVSDDPQTPCHFGLHVGSLEYASGFGQRVVIVKVDPEHVVCVPYDCTSQKMRVCEYEVVGLHGEGHMPSTTIDDSDWIDDDDQEAWDEVDDALNEIFDSHEAAFEAKAETFSLDELPEVPVAGKAKKERVVGKRGGWVAKLDAKDEADLMEENMDLLRRYASKALRIVGAYRIPGGKHALVQAISKARK